MALILSNAGGKVEAVTGISVSRNGVGAGTATLPKAYKSVGVTACNMTFTNSDTGNGNGATWSYTVSGTTMSFTFSGFGGRSVNVTEGTTIDIIGVL